MPIPLFALGLAGGVVQGAFGLAQGNAQEAMQEAQINLANFQRQLEIDNNNINLMRQFEDRLVFNSRGREAVLKDRVRREGLLEEQFRNAKSQYSRNTRQVNANLLAGMASKNVDPNSGSARAILRMNLRNASEGAAQMEDNFATSMTDLDIALNNAMNQFVDPARPALASFVPQQAIGANSGASAFAQGIIGGLIGGLTMEAQK